MAGKCIANNFDVNPRFSYTSCDVRVKSQKLRADPCSGYCKNMAAQYNIISGPALYVNVNACYKEQQVFFFFFDFIKLKKY